MSKHGRKVPAPFLRTIPSVVRSFGPRLVLAAAACALLLAFTGGNFILSHLNPAPAPSPPVQPSLPAKSDDASAVPAQVLGAATDSSGSAAATSTASVAASPSIAPHSTNAAQPAQSQSSPAPGQAVTPPAAAVAANASLPVIGHLNISLKLGL